jgi:crotonobetainyl-CoA:carnitine CoA-transferase CaiB-like acyl-CoA transferase
MDSEGMADDYLREIDWSTFGFRKTTQDVVERLEERIGKFFMTHTKAELLEGGVKYNQMVYPIATTTDILQNTQLVSRGYWTQVEHPELGASITYPGKFVNASETPPEISCRAPLIGEHNQEIYEKELGLSKKKLATLKQAKVI